MTNSPDSTTLPAGAVQPLVDGSVMFSCFPPRNSLSTMFVCLFIVLPGFGLLFYMTNNGLAEALVDGDYRIVGTFVFIILIAGYQFLSAVFFRVDVIISATHLVRRQRPAGLLSSGMLKIPLAEIAEIRWHGYEDVNEDFAGQGAQIEVRCQGENRFTSLFDNPFLGTGFDNKIVSPDHEELGKLLAKEMRSTLDRLRNDAATADGSSS